MTQLTAFTKKELTEQIRTGRLLILAALFCLFGIMNPAIAKITPWMMELMSEQLAESGMIVGQVTVNAMTSWTQFFKNMQIALVIFLVMFSGILTSEYQKGTLILILTKGMKRWKILASKAAVVTIFWTLGCLVSCGITYGYNAFFWDNAIASHLFFSVFCFYLMGLWLITVMMSVSVCLMSSSAVVLGTGGIFAVVYLLGLLPHLKAYLPPFLMESYPLLIGTSKPEEYLTAAAITLIWSALNLMLSVIIFNRRA